MNILMDWDINTYMDDLNNTVALASVLNMILTILTIIWICALIVGIVFVVLYLISSSKYKEVATELNALRKQRKKIKRDIDRLENPTDRDMDELHDIEDDISEKQNEVNECLSTKVKNNSRWKIFLFIFAITLTVRIVLYFVFNYMIADSYL